MTPISLYWWRHQDPRIRNVGDELSPLIVELVTGRPVVHATLAACDVVAIGSLLEVALGEPRDRPIHVWGTGFQAPGPSLPSVSAHIAAVRGPDSAARLGLLGAVTMGDPALLADRLLDGTPGQRCRLGIVPHYVDRDLPAVTAWAGVRQVQVISPLLPPRPFIQAIAACDVVFSSSLHGLIVADALGVPNRWIRLSDGVRGAGYKFRDHFRCVGQVDEEPLALPAPTGVDDRMLDGIANDYRRTDLNEIRRRLIASFPAI